MIESSVYQMNLKRFVQLFLFIACSLAVQAGENELAAAFEARGMRIRRDASGSVTNISFNSVVALSQEDYRLFGKFSKLRKLWMSPGGVRLSDETLGLIGTLPDVEYFFGGSAQFTDDGIKDFAGWTGLRHFGLDHWFGPPDSKGYVGAGLAHLAALPKLESVRLGGCRVDNAAAIALARIKTLQKVDLFHTARITDDGVKALQALPNLKSIFLGPQYTPRITNRSLEYLSQIPSLEEIYITETWFTYEDGLEYLKKLPNLKSLKLRYVIAEPTDIARLKADLPRVKIEWSLPEEANAAKLRRTFKPYWESSVKNLKR